MKANIKTTLMIIAASIYMVGCGNLTNSEGVDAYKLKGESNPDETKNMHEEVHFTNQQFEALEMIVDTLPMRNMSTYVESNGQLEVPPQNEASVTAIIGANVTAIKVIEGGKVKKGDVLAYLSHPNLIKLQTDYINTWNQLQFLEKEYERQKKLYEELVGSGKEFQRTLADYQSMKGLARGYEAQLKMLGMKLEKVRNSEIYDQVPVITPIDGYVRLVEVKTGQYVEPQKQMFDIVNNDHVHADLMVFEKDMHKVKEGQKVKFSIESQVNKELEATIYSVGKSFEPDPKAIHLHAEIENKEGLLIPGMYVRGRILVDNQKSFALPEQGVVREGEKYFIFMAKQEVEHGENIWAFEPMEVIIGTKDDGWLELKLLKPVTSGQVFAWNNAYYLLAEMKKGEAGHAH